MFDCISFLEDYNIEYATEGKNISSKGDWIGLNCPRCGDTGNHLGFSINSGMATCWKCGYFQLYELIRSLLNVDWQEAKRIAKKYGNEINTVRYQRSPKEKDIDVSLPDEVLDYFPKRYVEYMESRNFDINYIQKLWDIKATRKIGKYKNRLLAPIYYRNVLMSYIGRDITDEASFRYKACDREHERRNIKDCLYGIDYVSGKSVIVVEGITDVWRLGPGSVATFGIKFTPTQVLLLSQHFNNIFVLFDNEPHAQQSAHELIMQLAIIGKNAEVINTGYDCDPAELSERDAKFLMREFLVN